MYRISELAEQVGLSRSTLLYYEKLGLITGKRLDNGYRSYSERDLQRLRLLQQLQAGGLTLKECQACLEAKIDRQLLLDRMQLLDKEIAQKQQSRDLLAAMLGESDMTAWHQSLEQTAPDAHLDWLMKQGFDEKQALRLKWLSKDMNTHEQYMEDFNTIFEGLDRWGPGSEAETIKAFNMLPSVPQTILEIGCGQGIATTVLARQSAAEITAVDNHQGALARLAERAAEAGVAEKVITQCASMTDLPFDDASFDVIWAEGCAYIMGVNKAFKQWRPLLKEKGVLVLSDLVWHTDTPSAEKKAYWQAEYPDMTTADERIKQAQTAGYDVIESFTLSDEAWLAYFEPLQQRVNGLKKTMAGSQAIKDIQTELDIYHQGFEQFGYQLFILQKQ
ncbi:MerR family transcriptional regulator [Photobacterium lutimaris]|uniref:Methyltransferase n=1 Tax=Photobacterium lutimaris TaxID=388278 RepID=A0A2T3IY53_9GAMM|nr:MerR family transcriptional regulator [Photobacterium lutimaris]PSU33526.1 methyltransferase [Photobacterium lutimaris]TDR74639.1 DNA-binding transcriptional MerR regulator [Photobacterium lutimaris]